MDHFMKEHNRSVFRRICEKMTGRARRREGYAQTERASREIDHINLQLHQVLSTNNAIIEELLRLQSDIHQLRKERSEG